jgi:hypothetical protein
LQPLTGGIVKELKMKMIKLLASTGMILGSIPAFVTPAYADIAPSSVTTATMASTCAADLGANGAILLHGGAHAFTTQVVVGGQTSDPAVEVSGTRVINESTRFGTGSYYFSGLSIVGDPYRVGGSVNMFGLQGAKYKNWANSEYDFTAKFSTTTHISYQCQVTEHTETYQPPVDEPGSPYYVNPNDNGNGDCKGIGPTNPHWGEDIGACHWTGTGSDPVHIPEKWNPGPDVDRTDLDTDHSVDETNFANGNGHETNGGPYTETAPTGTLFNAAQVVICISPKKLPGTWTNQNGYLGSKCTTAWFNAAPWGAGTNTSNGTYISVPNV